MTPHDEAFLREAIQLSEEKMLAGEGGPFGAIVVRDGEVLGRGWNRVTSGNDPTAHAEIVAIRQACAQLQVFQLTGATLYASCEPCPMCLGAILWARIGRLVYAATREDAAEAGFGDRAFYEEIMRTPAERSIPSQQGLREEARGAFRRWQENADRIDY